MVRAVATPVLVATMLAASPAAASPSPPTKQTCVDAATRGQIQRDDGKLAAAREAFALCTDDACPAAVRKSCVDWLADVQAKFPELVVRLDRAEGAAPSLRVDGATGTFDTPISLEPGPHVVRVDGEGKQPFVEDFTLAAGEKRTIDVRLEDIPRDRAGDGPRTTRPVPPAAWILGGVGVLGLAGWGTFGLIAKSDTDRLKDVCAPACSESDRDGAFRTALVADISLAVGVIATVAAAVLLFTRPTRTAPPVGRAPLGGTF